MLRLFGTHHVRNICAGRCRRRFSLDTALTFPLMMDEATRYTLLALPPHWLCLPPHTHPNSRGRDPIFPPFDYSFQYPTRIRWVWMKEKTFFIGPGAKAGGKKLLTSQLIDFRELNCTFRSSTRSQTVLALPFHLLQHKFVPEMHYFLRLSAIFTCWWFQYFFASHSHGTKILQRDGDDHLHSTTLAYGQTASKVLQRSEASTVCSFWDFHEGQKGKERWEKCCARE